MTDPAPGQERSRIAGRAAIIALGTLLSRVLGLVRDMVLAAVFSRAATDAWMLAFQIPNLLRQLFAEGAVQTAVLPVLTRERETAGEQKAQEFFQAIRGLSILVVTAVTLLGVVFSDELVMLFAPGFRAVQGQSALASTLTKISFPYIIFMSSAALGLAALNSRGRFVVTSFAPGLLNVCLIGAAFGLPSLLAARGQPAIAAMAVGALAGGVLQVLVQFPSLRAIGYAGMPRINLAHPAVREVTRRLLPTLIGVGIYYVDVIIGRRLLSEMDQGAITYYGYALRLCDFSQGIFIMALSSATLPTLSAFAARGELDEVSETFSYSVRHALFIGLPATALFVVLAEPIVAVLLQRGQFDAEAAHQTARALMAQGMGIFLVAGVRQLVLVYFALGDTKTPVIVAGIDVIVFALTAIALRENFGHVGVSAAVSVARLGQFALLFYWLRKKLPSRRGRDIAKSGAKTLAATLLAAAATAATLSLASGAAASSPPGRLLILAIGTFVLGGTFLLASQLLGCEELATVLSPLRRRLSRTK